MTTVIEQDTTLVDLFRSTLGSGVEVLASLSQLRRHLEVHPQEYAVVLGPSVDFAAATQLADSLRVRAPSLSVILVRRRVDTSVLTDALRFGIREVIEERDLTRLTEAVNRAYSLAQALRNATEEPAQATAGKVVTVFAAKGGVGKSTIATNLAAAIADEGSARVCLLDLDLAFGDVAIMLQQFPATTIADAVQQPELDPGALEAMLTTYSENLLVLAAPVQPDATDRIPGKNVGHVLDMLKASFDYVVVDTSPAFDDFALQAFDRTDVLVLVATLDIPALKNLKVACDTLDMLNMPRNQWKLLLNRADAKVGLNHDEVEKTLGLPIAGAIPSSRAVPLAINRGQLIVRSEPRHGVSAAIRDVAAQCLEETGWQAGAGTGDEKAGRRGGLRRRKVKVS